MLLVSFKKGQRSQGWFLLHDTLAKILKCNNFADAAETNELDWDCNWINLTNCKEEINM